MEGPPRDEPVGVEEHARPMAEAPERQVASRALTRSRGLTKLSRLQTIGILYAFLGVTLILRVAGALDPDEVVLTIGIGELAPRIPVRPFGFVLGTGLLCCLAGAVALAERWTGRYAAVGLILATVLMAPLVLVASLALSAAGSMNVLPLVVESLRLGTPIALGALAGLFAERSGIVNIGIEGMMLAGAGVGFVVYAVLGAGQGGWPLWVAVLAAVGVGGLMAALHAMLCVTFHTDQIVSGVAINLLAIGITSFLRREVLLPLGIGGAITLPTIQLPLLSQLPILGPALFTGKPIFLTMFVIFVLTQVALFRTAWGLRVRSVGEHPHAAETLGVNVAKMRYQAVIAGGLIAGLGGAWFSLETVGSFDDVMTNGKGFIALAALIFGKWRPWGAFGGAMLFGFSEALGRRIQLLDVAVGGFPIPSQFLQVLPFVVTVVVLAGAIGRAIPPAAVGVPYRRDR